MAASNDGEGEGDSYIPRREKNGKHEANESENASGASRQRSPDATNQNASSTTNSDRLECTGEGRGRLRDLDNHASWRDVYAANHVEVVADE